MTSKKFFYTLIGFFVLLIGLGVGTLYFGNSLLSKESKRISEAKANEEILEQKKRVKAQLEKRIKEIDDIKKLAEKFLPDTKNQEELIAEFYAIANKYHIPISGISFNDSGLSVGGQSQTSTNKDLKGVLVFPFKVSGFQTDFTTLINFMNEVENNRRRMQITSIDLQPSSGLINVGSLSIEAYLRGSVPTKTGAKK